MNVLGIQASTGTTAPTRRPSGYTLYLIVAATLIFGGMFVSWIRNVVTPALSAAGGGHQLLFAFAGCWLLLVLGLQLLGARYVGPLGLDRAIITWVFGEPGATATVLRRCLRRRVAAAATVGVAAGVIGAVVLSGLADDALIAGMVVMPGIAGVGAVLVNATAQAQHRDIWTKTALQWTGRALTAAGLVCWYVAVRWPTALGSALLPGLAVAVALLLTAAVAGLSKLRRAVRNGTIPVWELERGGAALAQLHASVVMLSSDPLAGGRSRERRRSIAVPIGLAAGTPLALVIADILRMCAQWPVWLAVAIWLPLPGALGRTAAAGWASVALHLLVFGVFARFGDWLSLWETSPSARYLLPWRWGAVRAALVVGPAAGAAVTAVLSAALGNLPWYWAGSAVIAGILGLLRRARERDASADFSVVIATPVGALPTRFVQRMLAGWDFVTILGLTAFALPPVASFRLTVAVAAVYGTWRWLGRLRRDA